MIWSRSHRNSQGQLEGSHRSANRKRTSLKRQGCKSARGKGMFFPKALFPSVIFSTIFKVDRRVVLTVVENIFKGNRVEKAYKAYSTGK